MDNITVVIDTREKNAYSFTMPSEIGTLSTGDYSLVGAEHLIAVERKELGDLINCLTHDRERFEKELYRSMALERFYLVIEAPLSDLANGNYRSQMTPKSCVQSLLAFMVRYNLNVIFAENRTYGARVTESLLCKYATELEKKHKLIERKNG